jgi:ubiquinone/menaquinone biosynthesis C-methylase UbiE
MAPKENIMSKMGDLLFVRKHRLCPRWLCFTFDNRIRRFLQDPDRIMSSFIRPGYTVVDVGPGIGFFTIPIARLVGDGGQVIAVDIQEKMLNAILARAHKVGVSDRIRTVLAGEDDLNVTVPANFILAFWMAHEVPDQERFFTQLHTILKESGRFLLAEPKLHVARTQFEKSVSLVQKSGFKLLDRPAISLSHAALFIKH